MPIKKDPDWPEPEGDVDFVSRYPQGKRAMLFYAGKAQFAGWQAETAGFYWVGPGKILKANASFDIISYDDVLHKTNAAGKVGQAAGKVKKLIAASSDEVLVQITTGNGVLSNEFLALPAETVVVAVEDGDDGPSESPAASTLLTSTSDADQVFIEEVDDTAKEFHLDPKTPPPAPAQAAATIYIDTPTPPAARGGGVNSAAGARGTAESIVLDPSTPPVARAGGGGREGGAGRGGAEGGKARGGRTRSGLSLGLKHTIASANKQTFPAAMLKRLKENTAARSKGQILPKEFWDEDRYQEAISDVYEGMAPNPHNLGLKDQVKPTPSTLNPEPQTFNPIPKP